MVNFIKSARKYHPRALMWSVISKSVSSIMWTNDFKVFSFDACYKKFISFTYLLLSFTLKRNLAWCTKSLSGNSHIIATYMLVIYRDIKKKLAADPEKFYLNNCTEAYIFPNMSLLTSFGFVAAKSNENNMLRESGLSVCVLCGLVS